MRIAAAPVAPLRRAGRSGMMETITDKVSDHERQFQNPLRHQRLQAQPRAWNLTRGGEEFGKVKFSVGYQQRADWIDAIVERASSIYDVYFSFGTMPSGRAAVVDVERQLDDLGRLADSGIALNILFNANCYGARAESKELFGEIGEALDRFSEGGALESVTTTSPLIARFVKENFPELKTRASVNMEIGTIEGMEYLADRFDGYYVKRELNRNLAAFGALKKWADENGKELFMLANSGCLNYCSSHIFHDNLVAHEAEIAREDNGYAYRGTCWEYLKRETDKAKILARWNWVRPEDIHLYEGLVAAAKLATRVNVNPVRVLESYVSGSHAGNILDLMEPNHSSVLGDKFNLLEDEACSQAQ